MKKILFLLSILFFQFIFLTEVNATTGFEFACRYVRPSDGDYYFLRFKQIARKLEVISCSHNSGTCDGDYEYILEGTVNLGSAECPSSMDIIEDNGKTAIKWVGAYEGEYKYGAMWQCLYTVFQTKPINKEHDVSQKFEMNCDHNPYIYIYKIDDIFYMYHQRNCLLNSTCGDLSSFNSGADVSSKCGSIESYKIEGFDSALKTSKKNLSTNECPAMKVSISDGKYKVEKVLFVGDYKYPKIQGNIFDTYKEKNSFYLMGHFIGYYKNKSDITDTGGNITCLDYFNEEDCKTDMDNVACVWQENENSPNGGFCNVDNLLYVSCGGADDIPLYIPGWISLLVNLLKIVTPIILIFVSVISLLKALSSSKEDEMKKAQSSLISKIIAAVMVFFVITIVQFVISKVAEDDEYQGFTDCLNCFLNNECSEAAYYRTVIAGEDNCTMLKTGQTASCDALDELINTDIQEES